MTENQLNIIAGASIGIISIVIGFVLNALYGNYLERRKIRKDSLKNHFKELEESVIKPFSEFIKPIYNADGILQTRSVGFTSSKFYWPTREFEQAPYPIFKMHFPTQSSDAMKLINKIDKHNEKYELFMNDIKRSVEEKTHITVEDSTKIPCIYPNIVDCLRRTLYQLAEAKLTGKQIKYLYCDFNKTEVLYLDGLQQWVLGDNAQTTIFGRFSNREEANLTRSSLIEFQESDLNIERMCDFYSEANRLENAIKAFLSTLDFVSKQYRELGQELDEEKDCSYCQVIFHPKKRSKNV